MSENGAEANPERTGFPITAVGVGALGLAAGLGGVGLVETGSRIGIEGGIMLLVAALGMLAVAVGGRPYGPDVEGELDLSSRIGLGLLGGVLAGLVHGLLTEASGAVGLTLLLGVGVDVDLSAGQYLVRAVYGSIWGLAFGVLYPVVPGSGFAGRGGVFSLLPSAYTLLVVYPAFLGLGLLGVRQGFLTFAFVLVGNAIAGLVAAWVIAWGAGTDLAPISEPLVE